MKDMATEFAAAPVVRGMGVFCPLGTTCSALEQALVAGRDSIATVQSFDASTLLSDQASSFGADVDVQIDPAEAAWMDRATLFTIAAYREAIADSGIDLSAYDPSRIAVCLGSSHSGLIRTEDVARSVIEDETEGLDPKIIAATLVSHCTAVIKRMVGAKGRIMTVSSACASSNSAIGIGTEMIRCGEADIVIAGGADTVSLSVMAGFNALRALAPGKSAPFAQDIGLSIGEGAGIVVLTRADLETDAPKHAQVLGYGLSGDAHHATAPDQDGAGAANAIVAALQDATIEAAEVGYVNAHGTGTEANDGAESRAIARLFGKSIPVSSTKSYYGHTLGASGVIETITSIMLARRGIAPANLRMDHRREGVEDIHFAQQGDTLDPKATLLINNFGFGGNNSSILVSLDDTRRGRMQPETDEIVITGAGVCSAAGEGMEAFAQALNLAEPLAATDEESGVAMAKVGPLRFTTQDLKPFARTSPTTKHALVALREAIGADKEVFAENQRSGLIGGVVFGAQKPTEKFMESVFMGDPALANAHFFPMITMNATGGAASLAFGVKGYTTTVCGSASALAYAADLAQRDRQDRVAVISGDESTAHLGRIYARAGVVGKVNSPRPGRATSLGEFGAAVTLERASAAAARGAVPIAKLKGWATRQDPQDLSVAPSGDALLRALSAAFDAAGVVPEDVNTVVLLDTGLAPTRTASTRALSQAFADGLPSVIRPDAVFGYAPSAGAMMCVAASLSVDRGLTLACGYDVIGEAFAFVIEGAGA